MARLYSCSRHWLARVANELLPLQIDGRANISEDSLDWHSRIHILPVRDGRARVSIELRTRKNAPEGESVSRACSCRGSRGPKGLLCGVCALLAQVQEGLQMCCFNEEPPLFMRWMSGIAR